MPLKLEIKSIISPDLDHGKEPIEPDNCAVFKWPEIYSVVLAVHMTFVIGLCKGSEPI